VYCSPQCKLVAYPTVEEKEDYKSNIKKMENIIKYTIIALLSISVVSSILLIGEERKPITAGAAVFTTIISFLLIFGLIIYF